MWVSWSCDKTLSENSLRGQVKLQELLKKKLHSELRLHLFSQCANTRCVEVMFVYL